MDVILQCAFGMKADAQDNPDDPAITAAKRSINGTALQRAILAALSLIPFRDKIAKVFPSLLTRDMKDLMDIARHISQGAYVIPWDFYGENKPPT